MIFTKTYAADALPDVNRRETFRYASCPRDQVTERENALLDECIAELCPALSCRVCWSEFPVTADGCTLDLGFTKVTSAALAKNLTGCGRIVLFAATVGPAPDRLCTRYGRISPVKSLFLQALGAERIEALCDTFCGGWANTRPRFSPGYGDLPLHLQQEIFAALDCPRKIGLSLNDSLLMSPSKSVTALMGIVG